MKIAVNALFLVSGRGGGLETYLKGVLSSLARLDKRNEYLVFTNTDCAGSLPLAENFREIPLKVSASKRFSKNIYEQHFFPARLKQEGVELLFNPGNIAPERHHCPSIAVIHDMIPYIRPEGFSFLERSMLRRLFGRTAKTSDRIVTVSEYSKREIVSRYKLNADKVVVIGEGADPSFKPTTTGALAESLGDKVGSEGYILSVASSRKYKNLAGLVSAFKRLKKYHAFEPKLVITGHAEKAQRELLALISELGLKGEVVFTGFVETEELKRLYAGARVFVYPSFFEGFGLPLLEAFACGVPVASSNAASLPEVAGSAAMLFNPLIEAEMADAILRLATDERLREEKIEKGFLRLKIFTWDNTAKKLLELFSEVAGE